MKHLTKAAALLSALLFSTSFLFSQCQGTCGINLIPNPDFETPTVLCDFIRPQLDRQQIYQDQTPVESWYGTSPAPPSGGLGTGNTPDYIAPCSINLDWLFNTSCMSGTGRVGFYAEFNPPSAPSANYREYVQAHLLSPLIAGRTYCFSVLATGENEDAFSDSFGAWFYASGPVTEAMNGGGSFFGAGSVINAHPQVQNTPGNFIDSTCKLVTGTFCAQGGEEWIMIGNFNDDAHTPLHPGSGSSPGVAYILIDDVALYEVCRDVNIVSAAGSTINCGQSTTLSASSNSNDPNLSYTWTSSNGDTLSGPGPHVISPADTTTYQVIVSGPTLCVPDTATITVNVFCGVSTSLNDTVICSGECYTIIAGPSIGGAQPLTYTWTPNIGGNDIGPFRVCPSSTTVYHLTVTDANGLTATDSAVVTVIPGPVANAGADVTICAGDSVHLIGTSDIGTLQWINGAAGADYSVSPSVTTPYYLEADNSGCTDIDTVNVTVLPPPVSVLSADPAFMYDDNPLTTITNTSQNSDTCFLAFGDGTQLTGCYNSTEHAYGSPGNYTLTQIVSNALGCSDTNSISVEVAPASVL